MQLLSDIFVKLPGVILATMMAGGLVPPAMAQEGCELGPAVLSVNASEEQIRCALTTSQRHSVMRSMTISETRSNSSDIAPARFAIEFEFGSADLTIASQAFLATVANVIGKDDTLKTSAYFIDGHTDAVGSADANETLGFERAHAAADYILEQIEHPVIIKIRSFGETKLLNEDDPGDGANRRVEITPVAAE